MDPISMMRSCYDYYDQEIPGFDLTHIPAVTHFLKHPKRGLKYAVGEMKIGLFSSLLLNIGIFQLLSKHTASYLQKSFVSTLFFYLLFAINSFGFIPKIITFRNFSSLQIDQENRVLRAKLIRIYSKRIYRVTTNFAGTSIITHLLVFFISLKYFFFESLESDVDYHLLIYSTLYHVRLFYSFYRYRSYFYHFLDDGANGYDLKLLTYDDGLSKSQKKCLEKCVICWLDYGEGDKLAEFPCSGNHIFHLDCLYGWFNRSASCPLCRTSLF